MIKSRRDRAFLSEGIPLKRYTRQRKDLRGRLLNPERDNSRGLQRGRGAGCERHCLPLCVGGAALTRPTGSALWGGRASWFCRMRAPAAGGMADLGPFRRSALDGAGLLALHPLRSQKGADDTHPESGRGKRQVVIEAIHIPRDHSHAQRHHERTENRFHFGSLIPYRSPNTRILAGFILHRPDNSIVSHLVYARCELLHTRGVYIFTDDLCERNPGVFGGNRSAGVGQRPQFGWRSVCRSR